MFRIEGIARRRVFVTDVCVHPAARGLGIGTALLRSAAHVVRVEYARGAVLAVPESPATERTALAAGFVPQGILEDVLLLT
jgi:ribosomal protein S18 acetylase RimI-like enzyme